MVAELCGADLHDQGRRRGIGIPVGFELRGARRGLQHPRVLRCSGALHVVACHGVSSPLEVTVHLLARSLPAKDDICCHEYRGLEILL
jgi:hypothetical protein